LLSSTYKKTCKEQRLPPQQQALFPLTENQDEPFQMTMKIAKYVSLIGHPLLTIPIFIVPVLFHIQDFKSALSASALIVFGIIVPLIIKMYWGEKKGVYTNFDVSDQGERKSWYFFAIVLLLLTFIILFATNQSHAVRVGFLLSVLLLLSSQVVNYFIKSSLHVSFNIFLSFMILSINIYLAALLFMFVVAIAWSRVYLERHTIKEVMTGAILGTVYGLLLQTTV
jgi:membrane-associated phospholipid phosphatase